MNGPSNRSVWTCATAVAAALLLASATVGAQGLYLGGSYGWTGVEMVDDGVEWATFEDNADGYKVFAGFDGHFFGFEAAWINFGCFDASELEGFDEGWAEAETDAWSLALTAHIPLGSFLAATAKAGYYAWDSQVTGTEDFLNQWGDAARSGEDYFYGFGLLVSVSKHFGIVGEWEKYPSEGSFDFEMMSLGLRFSL